VKTALIVNPVSGRIRYPEQIEWLKKELSRRGSRIDVKLTRGPLEGIRLAREAAGEGAGLVVAVGGDGTLNEVINGIAGTAACLGIVPLGWRNVLARELKIPTRLTGALEVLTGGNVRRIDLGQANDRWFALMAGVGLDGEAVRTVNYAMKKRLGGYAYQWAGVQALFRFRPSAFTVRIDGGRLLTGHSAIVSNARYYGGKHRIAPAARIDDGLLDLCLFKRGGRLDYLRYFMGVIGGLHHRYRDVAIVSLREMEIPEAGIPVHADGDFIGYTPLAVRIRRRGLSVAAPPPAGVE
jgi:YegS/Rv2252/BmrU family lipid kinase